MMIYLEEFNLPTADEEFDFFLTIKRTCYNNFYPFQIFSKKGLSKIKFSEITIFYGGNGSGKSTLLNIIGEKLRASRESLFNKSNFYDDYLKMCYEINLIHSPDDIRIITSDDVFDYMLDIRNLNEGIDLKREDLFDDFLQEKYASFKMDSIDDYDKLKRINKARSKTQSRFVKSELMDNVRTFSNGESAYIYFTERILEDGIYLLDEPENSLSPDKQVELMKFIEDSARFYNCQFIISTHSPFLLSLKGAKIYDLDSNPVGVKKWTELGSMKLYNQFFMTNQNEFK